MSSITFLIRLTVFCGLSFGFLSQKSKIFLISSFARTAVVVVPSPASFAVLREQDLATSIIVCQIVWIDNGIFITRVVDDTDH